MHIQKITKVAVVDCCLKNYYSRCILGKTMLGHTVCATDVVDSSKMARYMVCVKP